MAKQETGVRFSADNIKKYLKAFADANRAMAEHNKKLADLASSLGNAEQAQDSATSSSKTWLNVLGKAGGVLRKVISGVTSFGGVLKNILGGALKVILAPLKGLWNVFKNIATIAGGILLRDAIRGVVNLLGELKDAAIKAASDLETLEVRMQNMIARSARLSGAVDDIADSFAASEEPALRMMRWIEQMAIRAPVAPESITRVVTLAQTMNMTNDEVKKLTKSILQFTTGMGLSSEVTDRIITNFLQMQRQGKVTGRELTDLSRGAMVAVNDVLRNIAGQTGESTESLDKFNKKVKEGDITVKQFIKSFEEIVERDLPEAFDRMSNTLQGSVQRLKNLAKVVLGYRVLKPVLSEVGKLIGSFVDKFDTDKSKKAEERLKKLSAIGVVLKKSFLVAKEAVSGMLNALGGLAEALGIAQDPARALAQAIVFVAAFFKVGVERITNRVNQMKKNINKNAESSSKTIFEWGKNIVTTLAEGMAAALRVIIKVIARIGQILSHWFAPGSPPRVAPHMDDWGAAAMTEFMQGFLKADFSVFNEISGLIEGFIRSLPTDIVPEKGLIPSIIGARDAVAQAIAQVKETGKITNDMIQSVLQQVPRATQVFKNYIRTTLELAEAQEELKAIQEERQALQSEINEIQEHYGDILDDLHKKLRRNMEVFNDENKLKKINKALSSGLLTQEEKARLEAEKKDILLREQIRNVEDQRDTELDAKEKQMSALEEELKAAQARVDVLAEQKAAQESLIRAQTEHNNLLKEHIALLKKAAGAGGEIGEDFAPADYAIPDLSSFEENIPEFDFEKMLGDAEDQINELFDTISKEFTGIGEQLDELKESWAGVFEWAEEGGITDTIDNILWAIEGLGDFIGTMRDGIVAAKQLSILTELFFVTSSEIGLALGDKLWANMGPGIKDAFASAKDEVNRILKDMFGSNLVETLRESLGNIKDVFQRAKDKIIEIFLNLRLRLVGGSIIPEMMVAIKNTIFEGLTQIKADFLNAKNNIIAKMLALKTNLVTKAVELKANLVAKFAALKASLKAKVEELKASIKTKFEALKTNVSSTVTSMKDSVVTTMGKMASKIKSKITGAFNSAKKKAEAAAEKIKTIWQNLADKLVNKSIVPDMMDKIEGSIGGGLKNSEDSMRNWSKMAVDQTRVASEGVAGAMQTVQARSQQVASPAIAQPASITNSKSTNVTVNANYSKQQSQADVRMDVEAALMASQI